MQVLGPQWLLHKTPVMLGQVDIMGKTHFPLDGELYLICAVDDHS